MPDTFDGLIREMEHRLVFMGVTRGWAETWTKQVVEDVIERLEVMDAVLLARWVENPETWLKSFDEFTVKCRFCQAPRRVMREGEPGPDRNFMVFPNTHGGADRTILIHAEGCLVPLSQKLVRRRS